MRRISSFETLIFIAILVIGGGLAFVLYRVTGDFASAGDVLIPSALEDAMSMQAQAERERQARVILGDSERQVAEKFGEAAKTYINNPIALHLRAMNMLYEGLKNNSTIVIVPSSAVETMQLGSIAGMTALTMGLGQEHANKDKEGELK